MTHETITLEFDGGSRGNPGPAGIGIVLRAADNTALVTLGRYIGVATNNVAEYRAIILGLQQAKVLGAKKLQVRGDSELIIKQLNGEYRVRNADLKDLYDQAKNLIAEFDAVSLNHNYRHKNALADKLANLAMDRRAEVTDADEDSVDAPAPPATAEGDRLGCARCGCEIQVRRPSKLYPHQLRPFVCQCGSKMNPA